MHTPTATDLRLLITHSGSTQPPGCPLRPNKTGTKLLACRSKPHSPLLCTLTLPATGWGPNSGFCFVQARARYQQPFLCPIGDSVVHVEVRRHELCSTEGIASAITVYTHGCVFLFGALCPMGS